MRYKVTKVYFWYCEGMRTEPTFDGLKDFNNKFGMLF